MNQVICIGQFLQAEHSQTHPETYLLLFISVYAPYVGCQTHMALFEFWVMRWGLCNAAATF